MENKGPIDFTLNAALVVVGVVTLVCIAFPKGFSVKTPRGHEFDSRQKDEKAPAS